MLQKTEETDMDMGETYEQIKNDFAQLGDTATRTDLAALADDYPKLLAYASQFEELPLWLVNAADRLTLAGFWNAFDINTNNIPGNTASAVFARSACGLWTYRNGTLEDAHARLAKAARNPLLPQNARDFFALHNARIMQLSVGEMSPSQSLKPSLVVKTLSASRPVTGLLTQHSTEQIRKNASTQCPPLENYPISLGITGLAWGMYIPSVPKQKKLYKHRKTPSNTIGIMAQR